MNPLAADTTLTEDGSEHLKDAVAAAEVETLPEAMDPVSYTHLTLPTN